MGLTYGVAALRQLQYGFEAVAGTAVNGDTLWPADATSINIIQDERETNIIPVGGGNLLPTGAQVYTPWLPASLALPSTPFGFELGNHIFQLGINAETATADGAGSDYIWEYVIGASGNTPKTATFYTGDNAGVERGNYGFATEFTISAEMGRAWMIESANITLRGVETSSFQSLTSSSNEIVLLGNTLLYINDVGDGFGGTQITGQLGGFALAINTGYQPVNVGDGNRYYSAVKNTGQPQLAATLAITFEHATAAIAERAKWRSHTARAVRLIATGSAFGTSGTLYSNKTAIIDFAGLYTEFGTLDNPDGDDVIVGTLAVVNDATLGTSCKITMVNEQGTV